MDFQDYYSNYLRQQNKNNNNNNNIDEQETYEITYNNENTCDTFQNPNYNSKTQHINNFTSNNSFVMQDEATIKTGLTNEMVIPNKKNFNNINNNNTKGAIGFTSNPLINKQRCFGRELGNVDQERQQSSQNFNNNNINKAPMTQNFMKPMGYTQLHQRGGAQDMNGSASIHNGSMKHRNMSVEYVNNNLNESSNQNACENNNNNNNNNYFSRNSSTQNTMQDENQYKSHHINNKSNGNNSNDKENYKSDKYSVGHNNNFGVSQQNYPYRSHRNTMDVEQQNSQQYQNERMSSDKNNSILDYTFPKDKLQKDPMYQHVRSIFDYLRTTEDQFTAKGTMNGIQNEINVRMRAIMVDWLVDVHLKFKLIPETLYLTINLIDRFIEKKQINKDRLQLLGATSMFIACKFEEIYPPEINDFVFICDSLYTKENILQMEGDIIITINFDLTYTSPLRFLERYCYLNESTEAQQFCAQYLLELSLIEYSMVEYSPSNQAASALYLVNKIFEQSQPWGHELRQQSSYDQSQLKKCAKDMWSLLQKANEFQYKYQKQVTEVDTQEQMQISSLQQWYKIEKAKLQQLPFDQDLAEELELEFDSKRKQIDAKIKEIRSSLLCNNKNLVAIIRKFSLPKFNETAKLLFSIYHP